MGRYFGVKQKTNLNQSKIEVQIFQKLSIIKFLPVFDDV